MQAWLNQRSAFFVASVPIDRTARGGTRRTIETTLRLIDPLQAEASRVVATLPGGGWSVASVSPND